VEITAMEELVSTMPSPKDGGTRIPWIGRIRDRGQFS